MSFPVWIHLGGWRLHPHLLFELLAYFFGFRFYMYDRRRHGDFLDDPRRWWVIAAAAAGAALGARGIALLECPAELFTDFSAALSRLAGKSIVGGIAGGWLAVEAAKRWLRIESRTGDLMAIPLAAAIAIGRIGCFLTGLEDHTIGVPTTLPWGVDFGDGIPRHPAPLYETAFLLLLLVALVRLRRVGHAPGDLFRLFAASYFAFRLVADFWKPAACRWLGLSTIQWASAVALCVALPDMLRWIRRREAGG